MHGQTQNLEKSHPFFGWTLRACLGKLCMCVILGTIRLKDAQDPRVLYIVHTLISCINSTTPWKSFSAGVELLRGLVPKNLQNVAKRGMVYQYQIVHTSTLPMGFPH